MGGKEYAEAFECVTIMFTDIVSYTNMAAIMEPHIVVRLLNELYSLYDQLVDKYDCYKVETIGDAVSVVGPLLLALDCCLRLLDCCLCLLDCCLRL